MKCLLVDPGKKFLEKEYSGIIKPYPNIGLIYIASFLKEKGVDVSFLDVEISGLSDAEIDQYIESLNPGVVGITTSSHIIDDAYGLAERIKKINNHTLVVFGGAHASALPHEILNNENVDLVVTAEGEYAFHEIFLLKTRNQLTYENLAKIENIAFRNKNQTVKTEVSYISDLDALPFPDWNIAPYDRYTKVYSDKYQKKMSLYQIAASRGCPFKCVFCYPLHGRKFRVRSCENIINEIKNLREKYDARYFDFTDSAATCDPAHFSELCDHLILNGLNEEIFWNLETRVDLINAEILKKIKKAGGTLIYYGIESGDDDILKRMNKGITVHKIKEAVAAACEAGLYVKASFIIGHAFETMESAMKTLNFALELRTQYSIDLYLNLIDVYPGTEFYKYVETNYGGLKWVDSMKNNWNNISRVKASIEVNDLTKEKMEALVTEYTGKIAGIAPKKFYNF